MTGAFDDQPAFFTVYVKDKNGKPVVGEDALAVEIIPSQSEDKSVSIPSKIKDNGDGTYDFEYEATLPGDYTINVAILGSLSGTCRRI